MHSSFLGYPRETEGCLYFAPQARVVSLLQAVAMMRVVLLAVLLSGFACGDHGSEGPGDAGLDANLGDDASMAPKCPDPMATFAWPVELQTVTVTPSSAWSDEVSDTSPFLASLAGNSISPIAWVKFSILLEDPSTIYFQDSLQYPFHHEFITEHMDPLLGIGKTDLDAISLRVEGQTVVLGAVLFPTQLNSGQYGIQFVGLDAYHPAFVKDLFERVVAVVDAPDREPVYLPVAEQVECTDVSATWFAEQGIRTGSVDAWLPGNQCYSGGWAVGRLVRLAADEVEEAALSGALLPADILLLDDAAPAELPPVAGVLSLRASTPNSHTAILAQSYGIPFVYLRQSAVRLEAAALAGKVIAVGTSEIYRGSCQVDLVDLSGVDSMIVSELQALTEPPPLVFAAKAHRGVYWVSTDDLAPNDIATVGGKAAHYGVLRDMLPDNSRPAVALTLDVWDEFLDAEISPDKSLRNAIAEKLGAHVWPPAMAQLDADLAAIRDIIKTQTQFSPALRSGIEAGLAGFDPTARLRFRSSTNVEDGATFTGAGLYDSYSGCLADDQDADEIGPSLCNPAKENERGVYRALRKVYASFYNRNAFLERLRRGVNENEVGMAVLVHHSFPDETEMANGVGLFQRETFSDVLDLVTQLGAVSVTNPDGNAIAERVAVQRYESDTYTTLVGGSSLLPLGATIFEWDAEYLALTELLARVADFFGQEGKFTLDFEYKKIQPGELVIKQVRPVPLPDTTRDVTPLLVGTPTKLCVFQGEYSDVFSIHRLKSKWLVQPRTTWLTPAELNTSMIAQLDGEFVDGASIATISGTPSTLPGFVYAHDETELSDTWMLDSTSTRNVSLVVNQPAAFRRNQLPIIGYGGTSAILITNYSEPMSFVGWDGSTMMRSRETVRLTRHCVHGYVPTPQDIRVERTLGNIGVSIATAYYWPPFPTGPIAGYTSPLVAWDQTTITGLTTTPIVLTSPWAQTHRPGHHNFSGFYLYEPRLDPGVDAATLAELQAADIQMIYADESNKVLLVGFDGSIRLP